MKKDLIGYIFPNSISKEALEQCESLLEIEKRPDKANVIFCRFDNKLSKKVLLQFPFLSFIVSFTTGLDHIDLEYCKKKNIKIISLNDDKDKLRTITSSSEFALTLCLMASRRFLDFIYFKNNLDLQKNLFSIGPLF